MLDYKLPDLDCYMFDMDHTLINNDCDVSWKNYLYEKGLCSKDDLAIADRFFEDYKNNQLDIDAFLEYQLAEFAGRDAAEIALMVREHFEKYVKDKVYNDAIVLIDNLLSAKKKIVLLTATNKLIAQPLADFLKIDEVLAYSVKMVDGVYTNKPDGVYSGGQGKVLYATEFAKSRGCVLAEDVLYAGDSTSDISILEAVKSPLVVNGAEKLREYAKQRGWKMIDFKS